MDGQRAARCALNGVEFRVIDDGKMDLTRFG